MLRLLLLCTCLISAAAAAQEGGVFVEAPDQMAVPAGGLAALYANVTYPPEALAAGIEGTVYVSLLVRHDGRTDEITVLRSPSDVLSEAALAAVRASTFVPARHRDAPVGSRLVLPVRFQIMAAAAPARPEANASADHTEAAGTTEPVLIGGLEALQRRLQVPSFRGHGGEFSVTALVRLAVQADGRAARAAVADIRTTGTPPSRQFLRDFEANAARAVMESRFEPATRGGLPVEAEMTLLLRFMLR